MNFLSEYCCRHPDGNPVAYFYYIRTGTSGRILVYVLWNYEKIIIIVCWCEIEFIVVSLKVKSITTSRRIWMCNCEFGGSKRDWSRSRTSWSQIPIFCVRIHGDSSDAMLVMPPIRKSVCINFYDYGVHEVTMLSAACALCFNEVSRRLYMDLWIL